MQENLKTTTNTIAFWNLPLLKRRGHPFLSPNCLFLLFSTCIERSLKAEPCTQRKLRTSFQVHLVHVCRPKSMLIVFLASFCTLSDQLWCETPIGKESVINSQPVFSGHLAILRG